MPTNRIRPLARLALLLLLTGPASAQIYRVDLTDEDAEKKYAKQLFEVEGERFLLGEARKGLKFDPEKSSVEISSGGVELFIPNPGNPEKVPYKWRKGERVSAGKQGVLSISPTHIARVSVRFSEDSLQSFADEYVRRVQLLEELENAIEELDAGTDAWFNAQRLRLTEMVRMRLFLSSTLYPKAAKDWQRDEDKLRKKMNKEGALARSELALESVTSAAADEHLLEANAAAGVEFDLRVHESQHLRLVHGPDLPDTEAEQLLTLAETAIEGFRRQFIDPYVSDTFTDNVPEKLFIEISFGPDDVEWQQAIWTQYYGQGTMREEYLRTQSWNGRLLEPTRHLSHCRRAPQADLAGIVVHQTGRALARFHYCADYQGQVPAWLEQALAYWLSIEYLGRNTVTSVAVDEEKRRYARQGDKTKTRESDDRVGTRSFFHSLALTEGAKIELLMQRNLVDMEDADIAKSWSFFDFLAHAGEAEQRLIFRAAQCQREPGGFVACWRASIETLLEIEEGDAFRALEERWRAYAETAQGTAGE